MAPQQDFQPVQPKKNCGSFIRLPVELLGLVFDNVQREDLLPIACACKLLHSIVEPHLYHSVVTRSQERLLSFRQALAQNPAHAKLVRRFEIYRDEIGAEEESPSSGLDLLEDFSKLASLVVDASIAHISALDISGALRTAGHLPLLTTCEINIRTRDPYHVNLAHLETLLTWPTLTTLTLHNINTNDGLFNDDAGTISKLRTLRFFSSYIDPTSLYNLMLAMENLQELVIHSMSPHGIYEWGWDISGYDQALEPVSTTLKVLVLIKEHGQPCEQSLRLRHMTALEYVSADLDSWFGYNFVSYTISRETTFQEMFPPSLKTMKIGGWKGGFGAMGLNSRYSEDEFKAYVLKAMMYSGGKFAPAMERIEFGKG
ncbi:uncharacterized protein BKCO1_1340003 [Diplodia corticola]|uniref:F-box domain-containing protein n=1 Tax=Diplodia corticola TaxID=236234 RepID=A0A1J9R8B2_9PEZI|nr:uncharacterized protein BKCO1_1340003 [Diplodia corticola]OJD28627.1 hypothetical protein BKCO1_1340003 [Diplodia corticola]